MIRWVLIFTTLLGLLTAQLIPSFSSSNSLSAAPKNSISSSTASHQQLPDNAATPTSTDDDEEESGSAQNFDGSKFLLSQNNLQFDFSFTKALCIDHQFNRWLLVIDFERPPKYLS